MEIGPVELTGPHLLGEHMELTNPQARVLILLSNTRGAIRRQTIAQRAFNGNSINFVPILSPLVEAGLIEEEEVDSDIGKLTLFAATTTGRDMGKELEKSAERYTSRTVLPTDRRGLPIGHRIMKWYNGCEHIVTVREDGFEYDGEIYSSMTAVAHAVRGDEQSVNGWAFFGLD
jgi:hypothetical protein